ncbi:Poly(A)-specific ribonuclease PARN-1 [Trypanosoma equiperdum]|uniref:Poly(A)-specific ribonuclease PARN-1 n=1 Tax=Trypanosoma equiperdum TaxID=5694 RepID=A0A1G4IBD1_TRYEQ|nr:Poly(A)-specific ribonuclease PARN-1 [Trypanosoma equiperdum]
MQVTRDNLPTVLPKFVQLLKTCDFYAFDEEMTGINVPELPESVTDTPQETYNAKRAAASRYNIIQVGICLFHKNSENGPSTPASYVARPFNFVIFPNHEDDSPSLGRGDDVVLNPSSLAFLRRHDMNFQSWVYRGMGYCDAAREVVLRQNHEEKYHPNLNDSTEQRRRHAQSMELLTQEERSWFDGAVAAAQSLCERARAAVERAQAQCAEKGSPGAIELDAAMDLQRSGGREVVIQPQRNKNARECLQRHIAQHFQDISLTFRRSGSTYHGTFKVLFPGEQARILEKECALRERELVDMLGFRLVFKALVESSKPCVGHNCLADVLFLLASLDGELPAALPEFKHRVVQLFPKVFDTKYIASRQDLFPAGRFGSRYLAGYFDEYGFCSANVRVSLPLGFEEYDPLTLSSVGRSAGGNGAPVHEAGYDALLTGTLLLNLLAEIGGGDVTTAPAGLTNRLALFRSLFAINLNPDGEDEYLPQSGALTLQHEKHIKSHHIDSCFSAFSLQHVALYPIDDMRTLAVLPLSWTKACNLDVEDVSGLSVQMTSRFPQYFQASPFTFPAGTKGAFRATPVSLARTVCKALRR